jgi:putative hemolysin
MIQTWEVILIIFCLFASGFFSGSEAVLMSLGIDRAKQLIEEGGAKGRALVFMIERPNQLLTTILVGNNVINILTASLATVFASRFFQSEAVGIAVGVSTILILLFGEIIPKTFARTHAESLSLYIIRILQVLYYILWPIVECVVWITSRILGDNAQLAGRIVTKNDIEYMINKAEKENTMDSKQIDMLSNILDFPTIKVKDVMVPRNRVKYIMVEAKFDEVIQTIKEDEYSRYPVCSGDLDNALGFLHVKDLAFVREDEKNNFNLNSLIKAPFYVYEHMKIQAVFDHMNRKKVHLALVKDENGISVGIITLEDIIEEILGEIQDEHDIEELNVKRDLNKDYPSDGLTVPGSILLRDLANDYGIKIPPNDNYSTLAGFLLEMLGNNFPEEKQIIVWEGLSFELLNIENFDIKVVRIRDVDGEKHFFSRSEAEAEANSPFKNKGQNDENRGSNYSLNNFEKMKG